MNGNLIPLNRGTTGGGFWKSDGDGGIVTEKNVTIKSKLSGQFVPRHETNNEMNSIVLADGELATTSDRKQLRLGDGSIGGVSLVDHAYAMNKPGMNWRTYDFGSFDPDGYMLSYGNGIFVAATSNAVLVSTDLIRWTTFSTTLSPIALTFVNGVFVCFCFNLDAVAGKLYNSTYISHDGINWAHFEDLHFSAMASGNGLTLGLQYETILADTTKTWKILKANDTNNWSEVADLGAFGFSGNTNPKMFYKVGYFFAYEPGDSFVLVSTNGTAWTKHVTPSPVQEVMATRASVFILDDSGDAYGMSFSQMVSWYQIAAASEGFSDIATNGDKVYKTVTTGAPETYMSKIYESDSGVEWRAITDYVGGTNLHSIEDRLLLTDSDPWPGTEVGVEKYRVLSSFIDREPSNYISGSFLGRHSFQQLVLTSPDGTPFELTVDNSGVLSATSISE